jgi:4-diphosphocytidyl-2-C-methyl-D-erythritol kinase
MFSTPPAYPAGGWSTVPALVDWLRGVRNDLEQAALQLVPQIGDVLGTLSALPGCLLARMSGSGATCFGLFQSADAAAAAARRVSGNDWWVWGGALRGQVAI